jgi:glycosyltransferase involved in cell wall biosynthesis
MNSHILSTSHAEPALPLLSVITVVYNGAAHLEETIQSVLQQSFNDYEYLIIDGGSSDGTVDIIRRYDAHLAYWVSEPDAGIYDAMNKGMQRANGKWLCFLNCGDSFFEETTLEQLLPLMTEKRDPAVLVGKVEMFDEYGHAKVFAPLPFTQKMLAAKGTAVACHQAMFVTRPSAPRYDVRFRLKAELNWYMDLCELATLQAQTVDQIVARYRLGGIADASWLDLWEWIQLVQQRFGTQQNLRNLPFYVKHALIKLKKIATHHLRKRRYRV